MEKPLSGDPPHDPVTVCNRPCLGDACRPALSSLRDGAELHRLRPTGFDRYRKERTVKEKRKPKASTLMDDLKELQDAMRPFFDAQRVEEARECPQRVEALRRMHVNIDSAGGNCPVQIEGTVKGRHFYFRARGEAWSLGIGGDPIGAPAWECEYEYGSWPDAGWMKLHEAYDFLAQGVREWMAAQGIEAGTDETPQAAQPVGREPGPKDAPKGDNHAQG